MSFVWYSFNISNYGNTIFNGFFKVNTNTNLITGVYETISGTTYDTNLLLPTGTGTYIGQSPEFNIYTYQVGSPSSYSYNYDNAYKPSWTSFDANGIVLTTISSNFVVPGSPIRIAQFAPGKMYMTYFMPETNGDYSIIITYSINPSRAPTLTTSIKLKMSTNAIQYDVPSRISKTTYGSLWFGGNSFPGFFYKKSGGGGGRRSTKFAAGGNTTCNSPQYIYNKYKPGQSGIGASSISNRRAKNRLATVCGPNPCFPCYMTLGQYSPYTHNQNGYYPCGVNNKSVCNYPYQTTAYWASFRGNYTNYYGRSLYNLPNTTTPPTITYTGDNLYFDAPIVIDKNGNIYACAIGQPRLYCFNPDCTTKWFYDTGSTESNACNYFCPTIGCDGSIYLGCAFVGTPTSYSKLFSITPEGSLNWSVDLNGLISDTTAVIGSGGNILVSTSSGYIYIISKSGTIISSINIGTEDIGGWSSSVDISSGLYFANSTNSLYILNLNTLSYITVPLLGNSTFSIPVSIGDYVYHSTNNGYMYKINKYTGAIVAQSAQYGNMDDNSPIVDGANNIYIGTDQGEFIKFDQNLNVLWVYSLPGASFNFSSAVITKNGLILLNDGYNYNLICIDTSGTQLWSASLNDTNGSYSSPAIKENIIYMGTTYGLVMLSF